MNEQFKIIEANAGSGKTFCLSTRLLSLLTLGVPANRIVALTFTKKAAGEIRNRVFQRLAQAALSETAANTLSEELGIKKHQSDFFGSLLEQLSAGNNRIIISTIDSFFHQIARLFSAELSLPVNWKIFDQNEYQNLVIETIVYALSKSKSYDAELSILLQLLNEEEIDKSIVKKAYRLTSEILNTHKDSKNSQLDFETGHPLSEEKLLETIKLLGCAPIPENNKGPLSSWANTIQESIENLSNKRWDDFLKKGIPKVLLLGQSTYYKNEISPDLYRLFSILIDHAKNKILESFRKKYLVATRLVEIIWNCHQELKHKQAIVTFSDIENSLADGNYNHQELYLRLDNRIDHFLIDEFQDTSLAQWSILEPFFKEFISSADKSCFVVGDKKQAIYGWRGGESKLIDQIKKDYPFSKIEQLNFSYRSAHSIIDNVNKIFSNLKDNPALANYTDIAEKWSKDFIPHQTVKNIAGFVQYEFCEDELDFNKISATINSLEPDTKIGILVQRNEHVEETIQKLAELSPPIIASQEGGSYLTRSNAVCVIIAAIKLLENPTDTEQFFIICSSPLGKDLTPSAQAAITFSNNLFEKLQLLGFARFVENLINILLPQISYSDQLRLKKVVDMACLFTKSDYSLFCETLERTKFSAPSEDRVRVMTIHQSKGLEFDVVILPDLSLSLQERYSPLIRVNNGNNLIPYPNQFIRMLSPELDCAFKSNQNKKVDESLSVLYVALTRAKERLFVFLKKQKSNQITLNNILKSEFFAEDSEQTILQLGTNEQTLS